MTSDPHDDGLRDEEADVTAFYKSLDLARRNSITRSDMVKGIAAVDASRALRDVPADARCTCVPGEGCDEEGEPGCAYCRALDCEMGCPADVPADPPNDDDDLRSALSRLVTALDVADPLRDAMGNEGVAVGYLLEDAWGYARNVLDARVLVEPSEPPTFDVTKLTEEALRAAYDYACARFNFGGPRVAEPSEPTAAPDEEVRVKAWAMHDEVCNCAWQNHADSFKDKARAALVAARGVSAPTPKDET